MHQLFEEQVRATPQATVAVVYEGSTLTYAELNRARQPAGAPPAGAGRAARTRAWRSVPGARARAWWSAILAILKAGGAYVPLDPAYPADRLAFMLADSAPAAVLTQEALARPFAETTSPLLVLDRLDVAAPIVGPARHDPAPAEHGLAATHLAYVIYTSGSTGKPKGVMVEHRNVVRLFAATDAWFGFGADDVWTLFHSFAFDFSVWEIWGALLYGGRLVVVPFATSRVAERLLRAAACASGVTVLNQTPSRLPPADRRASGRAPARALRAALRHLRRRGARPARAARRGTSATATTHRAWSTCTASPRPPCT